MAIGISLRKRLLLKYVFSTLSERQRDVWFFLQFSIFSRAGYIYGNALWSYGWFTGIFLFVLPFSMVGSFSSIICDQTGLSSIQLYINLYISEILTWFREIITIWYASALPSVSSRIFGYKNYSGCFHHLWVQAGIYVLENLFFSLHKLRYLWFFRFLRYKLVIRDLFHLESLLILNYAWPVYYSDQER